MPAPVYTAVTGGEVSLSAATAKSVVGVKAHANSGLLLAGYEVAFDGTSSTAEPVLVEICYATFATNPPGTNSTSVTPAQELGRVMAVGATAGKNWASEPTVLTVLRERSIPAYGGTLLYDYPLGTEPDCALGEGFVIRCTAPASVAVRATLRVSRC